jgi:hypothetical protein
MIQLHIFSFNWDTVNIFILGYGKRDMEKRMQPEEEKEIIQT